MKTEHVLRYPNGLSPIVPIDWYSPDGKVILFPLLRTRARPRRPLKRTFRVAFQRDDKAVSMARGAGIERYGDSNE